MATSTDKSSDDTSTPNRTGQAGAAPSGSGQGGTVQTEATQSAAPRGGGGEQTLGIGVGMRTPLPRSVQIDPKRVLWFGALVAVGALGVLEWPVVAAVGVGSYVAEQFAKSDQKQRSQPAATQ